ncbi:MAG: ribokinase, partial [Chloroflexi bacterium]|nr:ribokinase [Chloroflexota bacterium]
LGGKGGNSAVALARMGAEALLVGCVGGDAFGQRILETLRSEGVVLAGVSVEQDISSGTALIMVDDGGENTILLVEGANRCLTARRVCDALHGWWSRLGAIIVNLEVSEECVRTVVNLGRGHDVPVIVDAGPPRPYAPDIWRDAAVFSPNEYEAEMLLGYPLRDDKSAEQAADELLAMGPRSVVLKLGARGALVRTAEDTFHVPAFPVPVVDTTGAGDAFTAGLAFGAARGDSLYEAVRYGCAAGAIAVTRMGAMAAMPYRQEIEALLRCN